MIYRFNIKISIFGEDKGGSAMSAIFAISFLIAMNIATIWIFIGRYTNILSNAIDNFNVFFGTTKAMPIAFATIVLIPIYFLFYHKKKYEEIIDEVVNEDRNKKRTNNIFAILYQIITILFFLFMFFR